jgi:hypothetical protein
MRQSHCSRTLARVGILLLGLTLGGLGCDGSPAGDSTGIGGGTGAAGGTEPLGGSGASTPWPDGMAVISGLAVSSPEIEVGQSVTVGTTILGTGPGPLLGGRLAVASTAPSGDVLSVDSEGIDVLPGASATVDQLRSSLSEEGTWTFHAALYDSQDHLLDEADGASVLVRPSAPAWARILPVAYDPQDTGYTCGPTSLSMVLVYHGVARSESQIASYLGVGSNGVGRTELRDYVRDTVSGYWSDIVTGWAALEAEIAAGRPAVAHLRFNSADGDYSGAWPVPVGDSAASLSYDGGHFVVVVGLVADGAGNVAEVVCNDPANWQGGSYGDHVHYTAGSFQQAWDDDSDGVTRDLHMITVYPQ